MRHRGYTLVELIAVIALASAVMSLVGTLYLGVSRAVDVELARSELLAGAREVVHPLQSDVRQASALTVSPTRLSLRVHGQRLEYVSVSGGVSRHSRSGARTLGAEGLGVEFRPIGGEGVEVRLHGRREVRRRTITLEREFTVARRVR